MQSWFRNILILFLVSLIMSDFVLAQKPDAKKDSTALYRSIETYSKQSKFKTFIYHLIFKPAPPVESKREVKKKVYKKLIQKPYSSFEGKIIRNINIIALDPFGYSVSDTTVSRQNIIGKAGNGLHIKTQNVTILNLLLFRRNQPFSSILVKESERLIRNQKYVYEVDFSVRAAGEKSDSADIFIRVVDKWSIIPEGSFSASKIRFGLTDENFLGSGHEFQSAVSRNFTHDINSFNTNYDISNIRNSFVSGKLHFGGDGFKNSTKSFAFDRPFFSPLAKWAAGVSFASQVKKDSLKDVNSVYHSVSMKFNTHDYWVGKAYQLFKNTSEDEIVTNLIFTTRYLHIRYFEKPPELLDPLHNYASENFYLASIGISSRKYVLDKYIFKFGVIEDVPVGSVYSLTGGYQHKNYSGRMYLGMKVFFGNYNTWGYLSSNFEYGVFFNASHPEQGVLKVGVNYFTGLIEFGNWKFRQFIKPQMTIGLNRFAYDSLTLNDTYGLDGFNSTALSGSNRFVLTLQTQSFAPYNIFGFRFGPCLIYSLGMLSDSETGFKSSKKYSQIGLGIIIKNEKLVFKTFQISISFYPSIPGRGQSIFKTNSFRTSDFGFRDFEIEKPAMMIYQ